jgi:hypothetical protein
MYVLLGSLRPIPQFDAAYGKRLVQVLNVDDHWVCVTNVCSKSPHDVFVYDSVITSLSRHTHEQL